MRTTPIKEGYYVAPLSAPKKLTPRASAKVPNLHRTPLDHLRKHLREGMSTAEIDHMVYEFTTGS